MRTSKFTFTALAAAALFSLSGCITINGSDSAQPQPSVTTVVATPEATTSAPQETQAAPESSPAAPVASETPVQAIQPPAPEPAPAGVAPGTSCGLSNTGASTLVVAENATNINCDQVQSIFAEFNATFTSGDTSNYQIQGFTCHTRNLGDVDSEGRSVTCKQGGTRLEAMTKYSLGGIPIENTQQHIKGAGAYFSTSFADCDMGGIESFSVICVYYPTASKPIYVSVGSAGYGDPTLSTSSGEAGTNSKSYYQDNLQLPVGHSFYYRSGACINNGDSITCSMDGRGFTVTPTSHSFF